ncbi:hypothetical protein [Rathayibacter caricis]|uniref:hypothetical protein n=1 Tax=Rathayibacter caricis TaxID=110936 RepID=UPI0011B206F9|nr:hypothetical protein [Rathayibacter caricis]
MSARTQNEVIARGTYWANSAVYIPSVVKLQNVRSDTSENSAVWITSPEEQGEVGPVPNGIRISGEERGEDLHDAEIRLRNVVEDAIRLVSFLTNAAIDEPRIEDLYDVRSELEEHEAVFASSTDRYPAPPPVVREAPGFVGEGMKGLREHPQSKRLGRGIRFYVTALRSWRKGHEPVAFNFLYIAMEALTPVARGPWSEKFGGLDGLAAEWGVEKGKVDEEVRRRILFQGKTELHERAKAASDSMEHGFGEMGNIVDIAEAEVEELAALVRSYIVSRIFLEGECRSDLLSGDYARPIGCVPVTGFARGFLRGNNADLIHPDQHPSVCFAVEVTQFVRDQGMDWRVRWNPSEVEHRFAAGVGFRATSIGLNASEVDGLPLSET